MPPSLTREEYLWKNGRMESRTARRGKIGAHWPTKDRDDLVVSIEDMGGRRKITPGPKATAARIAQAYNRYRQLDCDPDGPEIGSGVPDRLVEQVAGACRAAVQKLVRQYDAVAIEEGATGLFLGDMNSVSFQQDGWEATIYAQGFSPKTKEPKVGADLGIVVDVRHGGHRVVKGFFAQAKQVDEMPDDPTGLPDLPEQIKKMLKRTDEAYVLIYGSSDVEFRHARHLGDPISVPDVMTDTVRCRRGSRVPEIIAEALHRDLVLEVAIAGPGARWPFTPGPVA